jgi:hypothetical protein
MSDEDDGLQGLLFKVYIGYGISRVKVFKGNSLYMIGVIGESDMC